MTTQPESYENPDYVESQPMVIGRFILENQAWVVAKMQYNYKNSRGMHHTDGSGNGIDIGQSQTDDPGKYGVVDGDLVALYVKVVWGSDATATPFFIYKRGSPMAAHYTLTGTTLDNSLRLDWVRNIG